MKLNLSSKLTNSALLLMQFLWQQLAQQSPQRIALQDEQGNAFTWQQLNNLIQHLGLLLKQQNVSTETGVALWGKNDLALLLLYLACLQLGAPVLGLNPYFSADKVAELCAQHQLPFLFVGQKASAEKTLEKNTALFASIHRLEIDWQALFAKKDQQIANLPPLANHWQRPATLTLTSGSSGTPKAVVHNMQAHVDNALGVCALMQFGNKNSWLLSLPLYHVSGQGIIWRWLCAGAQLNLASEDFYTSLAQTSHASLVPTQLQRFLDYLQRNPQMPIHTQHILLGGAQIPVQLCQRLQAYNIQSYSGYGMTEMASTIFAKTSDLSAGVGKPLAGREFKLVAQEIWLRGAGLALGYWQKGEVQSLLNSEGWFASKDLGSWQHGELFLLGRKDNMFISGGENIQPEEIEALLKQFSGIEQAFVLPVADQEFGERPVAMLQCQQQLNSAFVQELEAWLAGKIEKFKRPIAYLALNKEQFTTFEGATSGAIKLSRNSLKQQLEQAWQQQQYFRV